MTTIEYLDLPKAKGCAAFVGDVNLYVCYT